jgi:hypothetical protein
VRSKHEIASSLRGSQRLEVHMAIEKAYALATRSLRKCYGCGLWLLKDVTCRRCQQNNRSVSGKERQLLEQNGYHLRLKGKIGLRQRAGVGHERARRRYTGEAVGGGVRA